MKTLLKATIALGLLAFPYHAAAQSHFDDDGPIGSRIGAASSRPATKAAKAPARKVAADGFYFEHTSDFREKVTISFVIYPSVEALNSGKDKIDEEMKAPTRRPKDVTVHAFSVMMGSKCEIHMVDPAVLYQPEYLGHELLHCGMTEHFHPTQASAEER